MKLKGDEGAGGAEELDFSDLKPMDAFMMTMEDLVVEMERRASRRLLLGASRRFRP